MAIRKDETLYVNMSPELIHELNREWAQEAAAGHMLHKCGGRMWYDIRDDGFHCRECKAAYTNDEFIKKVNECRPQA